jgi:radial spoke head protein 1
MNNVLKDGNGVYLYPDGGRYEGEWFLDKKWGNGVYQYPDGGRFEGKWY